MSVISDCVVFVIRFNEVDCVLCVVIQYTLAVMNIGSPACGMNAAARSFVRLALTRGCRVLGIRFGFEGLVQDNVDRHFCVLFTDVCYCYRNVMNLKCSIT